MKLSEQLPKLLIVAVIVGGLVLVLSRLFDASGRGTIVSVTVPPLSSAAAAGGAEFSENCADCHGVNGSGTEQGPPLVHDIYNPGHHADEAFLYAVRQGVRQHHWPYGDMPAQPQVTDAQLAEIVRFVREVQEANGITYRPHQM